MSQAVRVVALVLLLAGCAEGPGANMHEDPRRIVSLVPAATEILLALGEGDRLVARTDYDLGPELAQLPSVGGGLHPSLERLVALDPDLVIRFEGDQDRATPAALDRASIPHLGIRPDRIEDIRRIVREIADAVGATERGEALLHEMDDTLAEVREAARGRLQLRVAFLLGGDPPWAVGRGTFMNELLETAGGENALADLTRTYGPISVETILAREVDLILIPEGGRLPPALGAVPVRRVPEIVRSPGVAVGEAARAIARILDEEASR